MILAEHFKENTVSYDAMRSNSPWWRSPWDKKLPSLKVVPAGTTFLWRGRMWRRSVGILYVAHPCKDPTIQRGYYKRQARRALKAASQIRVEIV